MKRSIILFPQFKNLELIQNQRRLYDPLANAIPPHITLVFPFESDITSVDLATHINMALKDFKSFNIRLQGITGDKHTGYLFLGVKEGNDQIIKLHDLLYTGLLKSKWCKEIIYTPHLTIGKLTNYSEFKPVLKELENCTTVFETTITSLFVEIINIDESSTIEHECHFLKSDNTASD